jgi:hypothetical protein
MINKAHRLTCAHCDSPKINQLPPLNADSRITWFRCDDCGRLCTVSQQPPIAPKKPTS